MKRCRKCNVVKPFDDFYPAKGMRDGYRWDCKVCNLAAKKRWYEANRESVIAKVVTWQQENRERYNQRQREYKRARPELDRAGHLLRKFGLTTAEFEQLDAAQGGCCAICGRAPKAGKHLHVDHDHDTGEVRGLLCFSCNVGVGNFANDVERLLRTVDYLETRPAEQAELDGLARERAGLLSGLA